MNEVFKWEFTDWGPNHISFSGANIDGGFNGEGDAQVSNGGVLVVIYAIYLLLFRPPLNLLASIFHLASILLSSCFYFPFILLTFCKEYVPLATETKCK